MLNRTSYLTLLVGAALAITAPAAVHAKPAAAVSVLKNVSVSVTPGNLAKSTTIKIVPAVPNNHDEPPFMNGEPEHFRVQFDNDKLSNYTNFLERQVVVYPLAQYGKLFKGKEKAEFDKIVWKLQTANSKKSDAGMKTLPILPAAEAFEVFHSHVKHLLFKQGKGIAYVTCYMQDDAPINNGDFFYTYQGITDDLKYYVSVFVPVQAKGLPKDSPSTKAKEFLNKLPSSSFTPDLDQIDKMVESISVK